MSDTIYIKCFFHLIGAEYDLLTRSEINHNLNQIMDNLNDIYNNNIDLSHPRFDVLSDQIKSNMKSYLADLANLNDIITKPNIKFIFDSNSDTYYKVYNIDRTKYPFSSIKIWNQIIKPKNQSDLNIDLTNILNIMFISKDNIVDESKRKAGITGRSPDINKPIILLNGSKFNQIYSYTLAHEIGHVFGLRHPFCQTHTSNADIFEEFVFNKDKKTFKNPFETISKYNPTERLYGNIMDYHDFVCFWTKKQVDYMRKDASELFS